MKQDYNFHHQRPFCGSEDEHYDQASSPFTSDDEFVADSSAQSQKHTVNLFATLPDIPLLIICRNLISGSQFARENEAIDCIAPLAHTNDEIMEKIRNLASWRLELNPCSTYDAATMSRILMYGPLISELRFPFKKFSHFYRFPIHSVFRAVSQAQSRLTVLDVCGIWITRKTPCHYFSNVLLYSRISLQRLVVSARKCDIPMLICLSSARLSSIRELSVYCTTKKGAKHVVRLLKSFIAAEQTSELRKICFNSFLHSSEVFLETNNFFGQYAPHLMEVDVRLYRYPDVFHDNSITGLLTSLSQGLSKIDLKLQNVSLDEDSMDLIVEFTRNTLTTVWLARCRRLNSKLCRICANNFVIAPVCRECEILVCVNAEGALKAQENVKIEGNLARSFPLDEDGNIAGQFLNSSTMLYMVQLSEAQESFLFTRYLERMDHIIMHPEDYERADYNKALEDNTSAISDEQYQAFVERASVQ